MANIEKVINGLECCLDYYEPRCDECPYKATDEDRKHVDWDCHKDALQCDALALLKEQEAVEPIKMQRMDGNFSFFVPYYLCGNCRYELVGKDVMFCSHCGRAVKWE